MARGLGSREVLLGCAVNKIRCRKMSREQANYVQLKIVSKELHSKIQGSLSSLFRASHSHPFFATFLG